MGKKALLISDDTLRKYNLSEDEIAKLWAEYTGDADWFFMSLPIRMPYYL